MSRYVQISTCHYLVDLDFPDQSEPHYAREVDNWKVVAQWPFLDAPHSQVSFLRAFYLPKWSESLNSWNTYYLLKSSKPSNHSLYAIEEKQEENALALEQECKVLRKLVCIF